MTLSNEVECDEAYVMVGHKGQPEVVKTKGRKGHRRRLKGQGGRGTLEKERPPVFGMMQRGGHVVLNLLANVKQKTIEPLIRDTIIPGTLIIQTSIAFMLACMAEDTSIRVSTMDGASSLEMTMVTAFVKCM